MTDEHTCETPDSILQYPLTLSNANQFSNISTDTATNIPFVSFSGYDSVINFGDTVEASWNNTEWERSWVSLQRVKDGEVFETVVCNVSDDSSFAVSDSIWNMFDEDLVVDYHNLYVGFEKRTMETAANGDVIEVLTRVITVAVIQD